MERNEETLSTRDLASPNEPVGGGRTVEDDAGNGAVSEGHTGVYDQHPEEESRLPVGEDPQLVTDERTGASAGEQTQLPATQQTPAQARTEASASDQNVDAGGLTPASALGVALSAMSPTMRRRSRRRPVRRGNENGGAAQPTTGCGGVPPQTPVGRCFRPRWTPGFSNGGRRSKPGLSTNPEGRSRTPIVWSRTSCSNSQRASQRNANGSKPSGAAGRTSPPRTCGSPCSAIAPSSSACSRPDITAGSREVPRMSRGLTTIWRASLHSAIPHANVLVPGRCAAGSRSAEVSRASRRRAL